MQMATILISSLFGTKDYAAFGYQIIKHKNLFPFDLRHFGLTEKQTNDLSIGMQQKNNFHYLEGALGVEPRDVFRRPTHLCGLAGLDLKIDLLVADVRPKLDSLQRDLEI